MHLAAMNGHAAVVKYFLSHPRAIVQMNGNNQNILDIAVASEFREVATVIAKHERSVLSSTFLFGNNQNILDIAVASEFREVATVIAKHERSVLNSTFFFSLSKN